MKRWVATLAIVWIIVSMHNIQRRPISYAYCFSLMHVFVLRFTIPATNYVCESNVGASVRMGLLDGS